MSNFFLSILKHLGLNAVDTFIAQEGLAAVEGQVLTYAQNLLETQGHDGVARAVTIPEAELSLIATAAWTKLGISTSDPAFAAYKQNVIDHGHAYATAFADFVSSFVPAA